DALWLPVVRRERPRTAPADPGAPVPRLLPGGDQGLPRRVARRSARGAGTAGRHAAPATRAPGYDHPGDRPAAGGRPVRVGLVGIRDPSDADGPEHGVAEEVLYGRATPDNGGVVPQVILRGST